MQLPAGKTRPSWKRKGSFMIVRAQVTFYGGGGGVNFDGRFGGKGNWKGGRRTRASGIEAVDLADVAIEQGHVVEGFLGPAVG